MKIKTQFTIHSGFGLGGAILVSHDASTFGREVGDWQFWISITFWKVFAALSIDW